MSLQQKQKITVLAISSSCRLNGNSETLLRESVRVLRNKAKVIFLRISTLDIQGCLSCGYCSRFPGRCKISDDFQKISELIDAADILILSSPIYFYGLPSQLKALIDRSQSRWELKEKMRANGRNTKKMKPSYTILVGATHGKKLFDGAMLTLKYFYDVWGFYPQKYLLVSGVDAKGEVEKHRRLLYKSANQLIEIRPSDIAPHPQIIRYDIR